MKKISRPQYFVSTDSIGILGKPEQFIRLWKKYFDDKTFDGVEIIAFKPLSKINELIIKLKKNNISTFTFHGKTGGENLLNFSGNVMMTILNSVILDVRTLLLRFPKIEFLAHAPYFEEKLTKKMVYQIKPKKIWVENDLNGIEGIQKVIKEINAYRRNGVEACGMLDVYHYVAKSKNIINNWSNTVDELKSYLLLKDEEDKQLFEGVHFPIGSRMDDSLPIDKMNDQMLMLFANNVIPHTKRFVLENQQALFGLLFSTNKMLHKQKIRNKRIVDRLKKTGVIR